MEPGCRRSPSARYQPGIRDPALSAHAQAISPTSRSPTAAHHPCKLLQLFYRGGAFRTAAAGPPPPRKRLVKEANALIAEGVKETQP